jgi:predicted AAA+ superfamily ATPase
VREPARWTAAERSLVEKRFLEFLVEGGFPEAQGLDYALRVELLQGYVDTVLFRDVVERYRISQVSALRWLVRQCLRNPAGSFSAHRLYLDLKAQGHGVAKDAVHEMLGHLLDPFLLTAIPIATGSDRRRNSNPRKFYPADQGLIAAFDTGGRANVGHALETVVAIELERRRAEVGYVKTSAGLEVDFLARGRTGDEDLIQVCADPSDPKTKERELRALAEASGEHPRARKALLVLTRDQVFPVESDIAVKPVYEWLLSPPHPIPRRPRLEARPGGPSSSFAGGGRVSRVGRLRWANDQSPLPGRHHLRQEISTRSSPASRSSIAAVSVAARTS